MRKIPFFNYPALFEQRKDEYLKIIQDVLSRGAFIMQQDLINFENELAKYLGVKHVIGVADGTMALLTSLIAAGIKKGDEVITTPFTWIITVNAILEVGAKPIFVDIKDDYNIDITAAMQDDVNGVSWVFAELLSMIGIDFFSIAVKCQ